MYQEPKPIEDEQPVKSMEYQQPIEPAKTSKPAKSAFGKIILHIFMILILGGGSAAGAYWWRDKTANESKATQEASISTLEKAKIDLQKLLDDEIAKNAEVEPVVCTVGIAPSATVIESIKASITSGNTAALEGYMAASVNTILAATEAYGPQTPAQSVSSISTFITDDINSWDYDFALSAAIISSYGSGGYEQYFPSDAIVGKSTDGKVISFAFDCDSKIDSVFMAASDELLAQ